MDTNITQDLNVKPISLSFNEVEASETKQKLRKSRNNNRSFLMHIRKCFLVIKKLRYVLLGTSATWFLIDVTLYGTGSFKSAIIATWFLDKNTPTVSQTQPTQRILYEQVDFKLQKLNNKLSNLHPEINNLDNLLYKENDILDDISVYRKNSELRRELDFNSIKSHPHVQRQLFQKLFSILSNKHKHEQPTLDYRTRQLQSRDVKTLNSKARNDVFLQAKMGAIVALLAIPGYILSLFFIHKIGTKFLQFWGFIAVALIFIVLGSEQLLTIQKYPILELILFGLTFLCSNFGPNTTTFIIPTQVYPTIVRATCHGFSAAMGKLGGVFGTSLFSIIEREYKLGWLLIMCGLVAFIGAAFTVLIPKDLYAERKAIVVTFKNLNNTKPADLPEIV